jgi:hypothetical protein
MNTAPNSEELFVVNPYLVVIIPIIVPRVFMMPKINPKTKINIFMLGSLRLFLIPSLRVPVSRAIARVGGVGGLFLKTNNEIAVTTVPITAYQNKD